MPAIIITTTETLIWLSLISPCFLDLDWRSPDDIHSYTPERITLEHMSMQKRFPSSIPLGLGVALLLDFCYNPAMQLGDIIKLVQSAFNQAAATEVQAFIFELQRQLHELKEKNLDLKNETMELKEEVRKLHRDIETHKDEKDKEAQWEKTKTEYRLHTIAHNTVVYVPVKDVVPQIYVCPHCFSSRKTIIMSMAHHMGKLQCPSCKSEYWNN